MSNEVVVNGSTILGAQYVMLVDSDGNGIRELVTADGRVIPALLNVELTNLADGDTLVYDEASDTWINTPGGA